MKHEDSNMRSLFLNDIEYDFILNTNQKTFKILDPKK